MKRYLLLPIIALLLLGCPSEKQVEDVNTPETVIEYVYVCYGGERVSDVSLCREPEAVACEPQPCYEGDTPIKEEDRCDVSEVTCESPQYCDTESGACVDMVPVSIVLNPGKAGYEYYEGAIYTDSFEMTNGGETPIEITLRPLSKYIEITSEETAYIEAGESETVKYRIEFTDDEVPLGASTLLIGTTSPIEGMRATNFRVDINRGKYS